MCVYVFTFVCTLCTIVQLYQLDIIFVFVLMLWGPRKLGKLVWTRESRPYLRILCCSPHSEVCRPQLPVFRSVLLTRWSREWQEHGGRYMIPCSLTY